MKTEQDTVASQLNRQNSSNPSTESYRLADKIAELEILDGNNITLKESYINLMDQLEIDGIPKEKISTVGSKIIQQKKSKRLVGKAIDESEVYVGTWWYIVAREQGCIDSHYSHRTLEKEEKPKTTFEIENHATISVIDDMTEFLKSEKQFLKHNAHDASIDSKILHENIFAMSNAITHANERFNNKLKISPSHYSILFRQFVESMSAHLSVPFYLHVRKKETFTAKQAGKIIRANVKDLPLRYEPKDEDESEACGFSGVQCPNCMFFRTEVTMRIENYETEEKGKKMTKSRGIRQIHCFKEDKNYDAPKVSLPASEVSGSDW